MSFNDLKNFPKISHLRATIRGGLNDVHWKTYFLSQVTAHLPLHVFHQCVNRYHGDFKVKEFTCLDQYLCMAFAQLTYCESLRDIEACLHAQKNKLYHMGIRAPISRNTLANANKIRDWTFTPILPNPLFRPPENFM